MMCSKLLKAHAPGESGGFSAWLDRRFEALRNRYEMTERGALLGHLLGTVIREQGGEELLDIEERIRFLTRSLRDEPDPESQLRIEAQINSIVDGVAPDVLVGLSKALELTLLGEKLDAVSKPSLPFPCDFVANSPAFYFGGTTIDGKSAPVWPMAPKDDADRY